MARTLTNPSANARPIAAGSLQSMNLGAMLVRQFGEAVNWTNSPSYQMPKYNPWVDLPVSASDLAVSASELPVSASELPVSVSEMPVSASEMPEPNPEEPLPPTEFISETQANELASCQVAPSQVAPSQVAPAQVTPAQVTPAQVTPAQVAPSEETPVEVATSEVTTSEVATFEETPFEETPSQETPSAKGGEETAGIEQLAIEAAELAAELQERSVRLEEAQRAAESETANKQAALRVEQNELKPRNRNVVEAEKRTQTNQKVAESVVALEAEPIAIILDTVAKNSRVRDYAPIQSAFHMPSASDDSSEEYLCKLERLVLELNIELGRRNERQNKTDPIAQLSQRIIELNLENLALKDMLQLRK